MRIMNDKKKRYSIGVSMWWRGFKEKEREREREREST
jgi:hypothetical protein